MVSDPQRILLIKPSAIGDVVHALPILNLLRRRWPAAHIAWLVSTSCAGILDGHPQIDELILFDRARLAGAWKNPMRWLDVFRLARGLRRRHFDLVIDLQGLFRSGWLTWSTRAADRIGLGDAREFAWLGYTRRTPRGPKERHAIERYLDAAEMLGCAREPVEFVFPTDDDDRRFVADLLATQSAAAGVDLRRGFAVLLPGTNWVTKRWPAEKFGELVETLRDRHGLASLVAGGPDASPLAAHIAGAIDVTCKTNLRQLVALLERAAVVITNDSGPMHIAAALGRPTVSLFGPTSPIRTDPFGKAAGVVRLDIACSPCFSRTCSHISCLRELPSDAVMHAVGGQLMTTAAGATQASR